MKLDIIIPTLNERENLIKIIPYLKENISLDTNVYVVDSVRSKDNSIEICLQHDIHYIKSNYACRSIQMNIGARASKGDCLLFLHADVVPPSQFQSHISNAINQGYKVGFFSYKFDSSSWLLKINSFFTRFDGMFAGGGDQCQFFTRDLFEKYNGYDEDCEIMEDFDMIKRLRNKNESLTIIKDPAIVSARKYKNNSYLKVNFINLMTFMKFKNNVSSKELKLYYNKSLN